MATKTTAIEPTKTYAVIETGGKQYLIYPGLELKIEKLEVEVGGTVTFDKVLLTVDEQGNPVIGQPYITGVSITADVADQGKGKKIRVIHFKSKSNRHKTYGHRQPFTKIAIK